MAIYWRISKHADLSGAGGEIVDGRWHTKGSPIVYLAESSAGALLESLVHLEYTQRRLPETYTLLKVEAPAQLPLVEIAPSDVGWKDLLQTTQSMGDRWLQEAKVPLARVPSSIVTETWNILLNPLHPEAANVRIVRSYQERFDWRLFKFRSR